MKSIFLAAAAMALVTMSAQANTVSGNLWRVDETIANNATLANVPATTPDVTFKVNTPFLFDTRSDGYTIQDFLNTSSAFGIHENTLGTLGSIMDNSNTGTLIQFKGLVTVNNGDQFTATHDDGLTLKIGNIFVINEPQATAPVTTTRTYTGPDGSFPFELVYGECCGAPAVLQVDLPFTNAPDGGSTLALLGIGLATLGAVNRKFRK